MLPLLSGPAQVVDIDMRKRYCRAVTDYGNVMMSDDNDIRVPRKPWATPVVILSKIATETNAGGAPYDPEGVLVPLLGTPGDLS